MKMRFGRLAAVLALSASGLVAREAKAATLGYQFDVTTFYSGVSIPGSLNGTAGGPDTGFFTVTNSGTTNFTGDIGDVAVSSGGTDYSFAALGVTLNTGASITFRINDESSNVGGFNGPFGDLLNPQPGVRIFLNGLISGTEAVSLSVNDADIHSGVPRTNPFGIILDSYVLQGGDPIGRDTGDGFEETQANGNFRFFQAPTSVAPLPSTLLVGMALFAGLGLVKMSRRSVITA